MTEAPRKKVRVYLRVSSAEQGRSGCGIEAQRFTCVKCAELEGWEVTGIHEEVMSGGDDSRPVLAQVLALCRLRKETLLCNDSSRCSRHLAHFAALLDDDSVPMEFAMERGATKLLLQIKGSLNEEALRIGSSRTKAGLAATRRLNGTKLGAERDGFWDEEIGDTGKPRSAFVRIWTTKAREASIAKAALRRAEMEAAESDAWAKIRELRAEGLSLEGTIGKVRELGLERGDGRPWSKTAVRRAIERMKETTLQGAGA